MSSAERAGRTSRKRFWSASRGPSLAKHKLSESCAFGHRAPRNCEGRSGAKDSVRATLHPREWVPDAVPGIPAHIASQDLLAAAVAAPGAHDRVDHPAPVPDEGPLVYDPDALLGGAEAHLLDVRLHGLDELAVACSVSVYACGSGPQCRGGSVPAHGLPTLRAGDD